MEQNSALQLLRLNIRRKCQKIREQLDATKETVKDVNHEQPANLLLVVKIESKGAK